MTDFAIRRAMPTQSDELSAIARRSKAHWGYPERWLEIWKDALTLTPEFIAAHHVYEATQEKVAGLYALSSHGDAMELEHMWVDPQWIGHGLGRLLMEHAMALAKRNAARVIHLDSDPHAVPFYERMGAKLIGKTPAHIEGLERYLPRMSIKL